MSTVTSLKFDLTSGWNSDGVDDAQAQLKALKEQIDDLSSKKLQITADATETQAAIADVKKQIDDLNQDIRLGVEDDDAQSKLADLKATLDALNNRSLAIKVDKSQADRELAALKLEMDTITKAQSIRMDVDQDDLRRSLDDAKSDLDDATDKMSNDWDGVGKAGRAASLNMVTAIALLIPAIVPLSGAVLGLGGAIVSAFGPAAVAVGVFGESVKETISSAETFNTTLASQKATLSSAQATLANTAQTNTSYTSALLKANQAQAAVNAAMANGGKATAAQTTALTNANQAVAATTQTSSAYSSALLAVNQAQSAVNQTLSSASQPQKDVAQGLASLTAAWNRFQQEAAKFEAPLIEQVMKDLAVDLQRLLPIIPAVTAMLTPFVAEFTKFSNAKFGSGIQQFVAWIVQDGVQNLGRLITFLVQIGKSIGTIVESFSSQGAGLTEWLDKVGASLDKWGSGGGFYRFAALISSEMPTIEKFLASLGLAIGHVITAMQDFSGTSLTALASITDMIAHLPVDVIDALFVAFAGYKVVASATVVFKSMAVAIDAIKVAYASAAVLTTAFALGTEGATAAESDNLAITVAMTAGRWAQAAATAAVTLATDAWTVATIAAEVAMSPIAVTIGLIVVAAAALALGIYELVDHWTTVWHAMKVAFDDAWGGIKEGFDDVVGWIRGEWGLFVLAIPVVGWLIYVAANWKSIWGDVEEAFSDTINGLKTAWDAVSSALSAAWNSVWNAMKTAALAVWDFLVTDWTTQLDLIKSAWDAVSSTVSGAWDSFWRGLSSTAASVWHDITSGVGTFASGIENAFSDLVSSVSSIWSGIESVFETPVNFIIRVWNDVAGAIGLPTINTSSGSQGASTAEAGTAASNHAGVLGKATGGYISGPGGPREDAIPARLSNGEYVMQASAVQHYGVGAMDAMNEKRFSGGGLVGFVEGLASGASHIFGDVTGAAIDALKSVAQTVVYDTAKPVVDGIVSAVPEPVPGVSAPGGDVPHAAIATLGDKILDSLKASQSTAQEQAKSVGGTVPTGEHLTDITEALTKAGVPQSQWAVWEAGLNTLITRESSWNPNAVNLTDSNAAAGNPSKGLMQTTGTTFAEYSLGGSITDPVSNIVAGIRYILATYGSISNVQQANASLPPKGYDTGGALMPGMTLANNTTGTVEGVLNPTGLAAIGGLSALANLNAGHYNGQSGSTSGTAPQGGGTQVNLNVGGITIHADGMTENQVEAMIEQELQKLATMIETEVGTH